MVGVEAALFATRFFELRTDDLQGILEDIEWDQLTTNSTMPVAAGYDERNQPLDWSYGVFGSKAILVQLAHFGANGTLAPMETRPMNLSTNPTWDGTGWDNELAAMLVPMAGTDWVGNDWTTWRSGSHWQHHTWSRDTPAGELALFGLSTAEVPEPWLLDSFDDPVGNWGVGGHNGIADDGLERVGYSFYAPYYPLMVAAEFPETTDPCSTRCSTSTSSRRSTRSRASGSTTVT